MHKGSILRRMGAAALLLSVSPVWAQGAAQGGFYGGLSIGVEYADVDYQKGIGIDAPPSYEVADDSEKDDLQTARVLFGYRHWFDSRRFMDGELDAGVYSGSRVSGYLEGTGRGGTNVFPGAWSLEKNRSASLTARFGLRADALGFEGGTNAAVYLLAGVGWLDLTMKAGFDNRPPPAGDSVLAGAVRQAENVHPWSVGIGVESEAADGRVSLEVRRTEYDFSWSGAGTGASDDPRSKYDVDVEEWGVYLGYVKSFSL